MKNKLDEKLLVSVIETSIDVVDRLRLSRNVRCDSALYAYLNQACSALHHVLNHVDELECY